MRTPEMMAAPDSLDELVRQVQASPRYRTVSEEVVRRIGSREISARRSLKLAVKATRSKLHQIGGVYFGHRPDYPASLQLLEESRGNLDALRAACRTIMRQHASTRERLPILDRFYAETLGELSPIRSVVDLGCGLNPLAIPWMPLAEGARYIAFDIYADLTAFIGEALTAIGIAGRAETRDVTQEPPSEPVDLALMLKTIPCLEQVDKDAGQRLLDGVDARYILVSFPVRSLGGYHKGMVHNYEAHFREMVDGKGWPVRRFEFGSEMAFVINKGMPAHGQAG